MKTFYQLLANTLFTSITNFFVWFALVFWMYLETESVLTTAISGAVFMAAMSVSSFWFGSIVDHNKKKTVMVTSTIGTALFFLFATLFYTTVSEETLTNITEPYLWILAGLILVGVLISNLRGIALPTTVTLLVPEGERDRANGMVGMVMGLSSMGAGLTSGFMLSYAGMLWVLAIGTVLTLGSLFHLLWLQIPESQVAQGDNAPQDKVDLKGTITLIGTIPGLFALIFFTTFNNFLGGVFMALLDPYGLTLVSVETWSVVWGVLSSGFILGGFYIAKKGLGKNPLRIFFMVNIIIWLSVILFPLQHSIILLSLGIFTWVCLSPFIEATEHTIIQKIVPFERQGRVFGFAQSVEIAASPVASFMIGPLAQFVFIPFMTTGPGVFLIGEWFGVGAGRGMALLFIFSGIAGLLVTLFAMRSRSYRLLAKAYQENSA